jgi:Lar family restriction alleviation protein
VSNESKAFWQDYQKRNGTIDVPGLLDLYAAAKDAEIAALKTDAQHSRQIEAAQVAEVNRAKHALSMQLTNFKAKYSEMNAENDGLKSEIKRLRDGMKSLIRWVQDYNDYGVEHKEIIGEIEALLSPAEPEKPPLVCHEMTAKENAEAAGIEFLDPEPPKPAPDENGIWIGDMTDSPDKWLRIIKKKGQITIREDGGSPFKIQSIGGFYESKSFEGYDLNDVMDWMSTRAGLEFFYPNKDGLDENGLLPCPFCGGKAEIHYQLHDLGDYAVKCSNCGCEPCPWGLRVSKAEAIEDWNRRAGKEAGV